METSGWSSLSDRLLWSAVLSTLTASLLLSAHGSWAAPLLPGGVGYVEIVVWGERYGQEEEIARGYVEFASDSVLAYSQWVGQQYDCYGATYRPCPDLPNPNYWDMEIVSARLVVGGRTFMNEDFTWRLGDYFPYGPPTSWLNLQHPSGDFIGTRCASYGPIGDWFGHCGYRIDTGYSIWGINGDNHSQEPLRLMNWPYDATTSRPAVAAEPGALALFGLGLAAIFLMRRSANTGLWEI